MRSGSDEMLSKVRSSAVLGIEAFPVEVEVDISSGLPGLHIVGLPDTACKESADRVRSAIKNTGLAFPTKKVTVNLAPADLKKEGSAYDLAIAVGILTASEQVLQQRVSEYVYCGELALDGRLRPVHGILPRAASLIGPAGSAIVLPCDNAPEAQCISGVKVIAAASLKEIVDLLKDGVMPPLPDPVTVGAPTEPSAPPSEKLDLSDIKGQAYAKRALEIAAAGGHNVLMIGPPGSGKTLLAKCIPSILSDISFSEAVETTKIHSVAGLLPARASLLSKRPFRDPHHTISDIAMIGGSSHPKPGEVSLAHNGVLFLDELAEFRRNVLEVLRQPLEEGRVTISRINSTLTFPARFMLVAAMNPCPCGYYTDPKRDCHCSPIQIKNYLSKVSGPLLDRMDIQIEVASLKVHEITATQPAETSETVRLRVAGARRVQSRRYAESKGRVRFNADLEAHQVEKHCRPTDEGLQLLKMAIQELGFSARAFHKTLKVARTIADLEGGTTINASHVAEAIHYRTLDKNIWVH